MQELAYHVAHKFEMLRGASISPLPIMLERFVSGLWQFWFVEKGDDMKSTLTAEQVKEMGKMWGDWFLSTLTPAERLAGLKPAERLTGLKPAERLTGLKPEELDEIEKLIKKLRKKR